MTTEGTQRDMRQAVLMHAGTSLETARVLADIDAERERQGARWGDQSDMADADPQILARLGRTDIGAYASPIAVAARLAEEYGVPTERAAKWTVECEVERHGGTWFGIAMEEVAESLDAIPHAMVLDDPLLLRAEIIQAAAVLTAWAEAIDRRGLKATPQREG